MSTAVKQQLHATRNNLPEEKRAGLVDVLAPRLAEAVDLKLQLKQAHWNVKGPQFIALHELFDKIAGEADEYVDLIAERIVQLGGVADGSARTVAGTSSLTPYPASIIDGSDHVNAVASALAAFGAKARAAIDRATELGDADTADIFTEISRGVDKSLWFVEAHTQGRA
jgi:starvation-inducible DNA-binding protein